MRVPTALGDTSLLEDEPLTKFRFPTRRARPTQEEVPKLLREVSRKIYEDSASHGAVQEWSKLAFVPVACSQTDKLRAPRHQPLVPTKNLIKCFVDFYWALSCGRDAIESLRKLKLDGHINITRIGIDPPIKQEPFDEPMSPLTELSDDSPSTPLCPLVPETASVPELTNLTPSGMTPIVSSMPSSEFPDAAKCLLLQSADMELDSMAPLPDLEDGQPQDTPITAAESEANSLALTTTAPISTAGKERLPGSATTVPSISAAPKRKGPRRPRKKGPPDSPLPASKKRRVTLLVPLPSEASVPDPCENIKVEPNTAQKQSILLPTMDETENWLTMPDIDSKHEGGESPVPDIVIETIIPKLPLKTLPPIWAQARQEVCESFEWFRSYQGGVYQNNGSVKGYFLSAFSAKRDCFACGGKLIISHGGGKAESVKKDRGQVISKAAEDQRAGDSSVRALLENYRCGQPLVLLIDDKYGPFPFDLASQGVYMAVLGFYRIVHVWAEYQPSTSNASGQVVRYKFAFQWCEGQGEPWWSAPDPTSEDSPMPDVEPMQAAESSKSSVEKKVMVPVPVDTSPLKPDHLYFKCETCGKQSPHVFRQAKACLIPTCQSFWRMVPSGESLPSEVDYNPEFLAVIDHRPLPIAFRGALLPKPPVPAPKDGVTTSYAYSRGWHCRICGRLSCRSAWEQYECPHCGESQKIVGSVRPAKTLLSIPVPILDKNQQKDSIVQELSGINRLPMKMFTLSDGTGLVGHCQTFELPLSRGKIHLIKTSRLGNIEADRIFEAYQQQAADGTLVFRRWPLRSHKLRGPLLTNYFSQNSGEAYQYVGGTNNTVPFDRAPEAVVQARALIQRRIKEAIGAEHLFNEVLSAAYMEQQKMAFHSDSEKGLGPVVAGLSMGSPALMHFRPLLKYARPDEQRTIDLTVILRHGDVLMMEGAGVQDYYEHTVVPCNFRIAATARWIAPNHAREIKAD
ncbi:2OG-FeII-Oxy-2 domain-containing protein [Mycena sanguinolenta]|uniref:2OG-FeII-Oxy-2 domain-containing protein n=1 Tax=Mycena sanguinolenta TaxID=230812 RepID=A0A8H6ZEE8_9AGAR|nr:2OG-FeII-Oxy-2 domain-containing protein [Mycena sanguinolenta]